MSGTKNPNQHREQKLKKHYGMSIEDYNKMLAAQKGKCLICTNYRKLVVDHCHGQGHVRGLLCSECNTGLGLFRDNTESLARAIQYLNERGPKK